MKTLITFITIVLFSFSSSAEYNKKFTAEKCNNLFGIGEIFTKATFEKTYELINDSMNPLKAELLEASLKLSTGFATLYEVYCKD